MAKTRWDRFVERFGNDPFTGFQPKGFTIKPGNLRLIQKKLRVLKRFHGKVWRSAQRPYADALRREKLFEGKGVRNLFRLRWRV